MYIMRLDSDLCIWDARQSSVWVSYNVIRQREMDDGKESEWGLMTDSLTNN